MSVLLFYLRGRMNRILLSLLIACCVFSCVNPDAEQEATTRDSVVLNEPSPEVAQTDFRTLDTALSFAGLWVNETYIDKIRKTGSPRLSQEVTESCITIPARTLQLTRMIEAFHEGGSDLMVVKDHDGYKLYDSTEATVYENIEVISPSRLKIGNQYFRRMEHYTGDTQYILEELLFSGRYERENKREVIFMPDGHVQGLDSFSRYIPSVDYTSGPLVDFDLMQMATGNNQYDYGYRLNGDTLRIFHATCAHWDSEKVCDSMAAGPMLYRLVRKK